MTILEVLKKARALIDIPEKWTKGYAARDKRDRPISFSAEGAVCFCLLGAIAKVTVGSQGGPAMASVTDFFQDLIPMPSSGIMLFNDNKFTTHADIMQLLDTAIAKAERMSA